MSDTPSILFICLGNICRSPMAEGAMRALIEASGRKILVDSAGTGSWHTGEPPDRRAQVTARNHGIDISDQRARQVTPEDFRSFTHIVAMDRNNLSELRRIRPTNATAGLSLMLDHTTAQAGVDVADPYYGGAEGFEATWRDVAEGSIGLLAKL